MKTTESEQSWTIASQFEAISGMRIIPASEKFLKRPELSGIFGDKFLRAGIIHAIICSNWAVFTLLNEHCFAHCDLGDCRFDVHRLCSRECSRSISTKTICAEVAATKRKSLAATLEDRKYFRRRHT